MGYNLYTSGPYKQADGSAITASSTNVDGGAMKAASTDSDNVTESRLGQGDHVNPKNVSSADAIIADRTNVTSEVLTAAAGNNGLVQVTVDSDLGLAVNDPVVVYSNSSNTLRYSARVVSLPTATTPILNLSSTEYATLVSEITSGNGVIVTSDVTTFNDQTNGNYAIKGKSGTVHGVTNNNYHSAEFERDMNHRMQSLRTTRTATAIRDGYLNLASGQFSTAPTTANDYTGMDIDGTDVPDDETKSLNSTSRIGGEFTYRAGQPTPTSKDYDNRS